MGRRRKNNPLGLPPRVYAKHGAFYYVHPSNKWERLGTDLQEAKKLGRHYNDPDGEHGTVAYWYEEFLLHCKARIGKPKSQRGIAQRTYEDYVKCAEPLKAYFGKMLPTHVEGHHIGAYLDLGAQLDRPVRANREKAALSACFTWLILQPEAGVRSNPCFGVRRNPESKRERYVEHNEYQLIHARVAPQVRAMMDIIYRTLQRPEDVITWCSDVVRTKREHDGTEAQVLALDQQKTGAALNIELDPTLSDIITPLLPEDSPHSKDKTLIRSRTGKPYTYSGLSAMFRRVVAKAVKDGDLKESFSMYDIKGKGATDMWLNKVPLSEIQQLCGHESVTTTEVYVKCRWRGTISPNSTPLFLSNTRAIPKQTCGSHGPTVAKILDMNLTEHE